MESAKILLSTDLKHVQILKRVKFVGDRVVFGMFLSFLYTLLVVYLINISKILEFAPGLLWILPILGITCYIFYVIEKDAFYYQEHVFVNSSMCLIEVVWICFSSLIGLGFMLFYGWQHVYESTILYIIIYLTGYVIARFVWTFSKGSLTSTATIALILIFIILSPTIIISAMTYSLGLTRFGTITLIFGIGLLISIGLNALMLDSFHDEAGIDVKEDPPSKLIIIGLINSMIVNFIFWIIMLILYPLAGGSKKKSGRSSRSSYHSRSTYRRRTYYRRYRVFGPMIERPRYSVNHYWMVAMGAREKIIEVSKEKIEETKQKIIQTLYEEGVVPSSQDLRNIMEVEHFIFDAALDELSMQNVVKYSARAHPVLGPRGYRLTKQYREEYDLKKNDEAKKREEADFKKKLDEFLEEIKLKQPIPNKHQLWVIANQIGMRPLWKINPTINELKSQGKITFSRKKPKGWYVSN